MEVVETSENIRNIKIAGLEIGLERRDPHGFWFITWSSGPTPDALASAYTTTGKAYEDISNWVNKLPKEKPAKRAA